MPGYTPAAILPPFSPAVTEAAVQAATASYEPEYLIRNLIDLSSYLVDLVNHTNFFGPASHDPYSPSLKTLHERLHSGFSALTPLIETAKDESRMRQTLGIRIHEPVTSRSLEDFEDLYYAVLARMQDMMQTLNMRLASGFNSVTDPLFFEGPSIIDLHASLSEYWNMFNDPACVRALDDAVRQSRVNRLYEEINADLEANVITQVDADKFLSDLFEAKETTMGIKWMVEWNPAMIGMYLKDKYYVLLRLEKEEDERQVREMRKRARMKVKIRKATRTSRSPIKRPSLEKMMDDMHTGHARLADHDKGAWLRRGPGQRVRFVEQAGDGTRMDAQQVDKSTPIEVDHHYQDQRIMEQGRVRQDQLHHHREWQLKSQRVSEYSNYLRGAASHNARSIVGGTVYGDSLYGSTLDSHVTETAGEDADEMEF
jgi:hypothetical protein